MRSFGGGRLEQYRLEQRRLLRAVVLAGGLALGSGNAFAADEEADAKAEAAPPSEQAVKLEQAAKEIGQLNYPQAQELLFGVIQSGQATPEELSKAYFGIGEVEAALGNEVESTDSFYLALMIQPGTLFPAGGSPKIRERLNEARSRVTEVGVLEASARVEGGVLTVSIGNDPLKLVRNIEVQMTKAGGDVGKASLDAKAQRVEVDADVQSIAVILHDEAGNQLKAIQVDVAAKPDAAQQLIESGKPSVWESWGLWAGVAGAFALGGTYFILESGKLSDELSEAQAADVPNQPQIDNLQQRKDDTTLYGVVGFSLAGAAAVTAGALLLFNDDPPAAPAEAETQARLVPSFGPKQVGAEFSLRF